MGIGRAWIVATFCVWMAVTVWGCGDDDGGNGNNANQPPDAALDDGGGGTDGTSEWDCADIGLCAADCGTDFGCINDCKNHGCQEAVTVYETLQTCVMDHCLLDCASDPQGQACETCRNDNCGDEVAACESNTCP